MSLHPDHANDAEYLHAKVRSCLTWTFALQVTRPEGAATFIKEMSRERTER